MDYPYYIKLQGINIANERKRLYYLRHKKDSSYAGKYATW
jgi:hypothetical protein